tara:strand:+ start:95 stop:448 length:354 start_codon:yes stop_codon:yes gene_type:complete
MKHSFLAILTLGMLSLTPSSANALDLKKESGKNNSCVQRIEDSWGHYCITSSNRVTYTISGSNKITDVGKLGGAENRKGIITQFEIEDGKLIEYECNARNYYVLECSDEVERTVQGK